MLIFSIETSCDETSVAIIDNNRKIISNITVNQKDHAKYGGVVPEIASRSHLEILQKIIPESLKQSNISLKDIDLFCATCGPGLIGGLLVGSTIAKSIALKMKKPFYPINHLEGHLLSTEFTNKITFPNLTFLLTGGHTQIYLIKSIGQYKLLGETTDDAIGESFDKVGKLIGLSYPGGPLVEKLASTGNPIAYPLPHPLEFKKNLNFSFSGIKTAVNYLIKNKTRLTIRNKKDIAASFQNKIVEILNAKLILSMNHLRKNKYKINAICLVGGVAANKKVRSSFNNLSKKYKCKFISPPISLCGDNAVIIANTCLNHYKLNIEPNINFKADPRLAIDI